MFWLCKDFNAKKEYIKDGYRRSLVKTIEKQYGVDLWYKSDAQLHTVLKEEWLPSLSQLLKMTQKK